MNHEPTEEEARLMAQYGIEAELKTLYHYRGHTYEHLEQAIRYAKIDAARSLEESSEEPREPPSAKVLSLKGLWSKLRKPARKRNA